MGIKSVKVSQPQFSQWVIRKRQEMNLSPACLRSKLGDQLSDRTIKYLEDGKKEAFSEYTLIMLARGLDLTYPDLLHEVDELTPPAGKDISPMQPQGKQPRQWLIFASLVAGFVFAIFLISTAGKSQKHAGSQANDQAPADFNSEIHSVLIDPDYGEVFSAYAGKGNILWQKSFDTKFRKVLLCDLDRDGQQEVIAATAKSNISVSGARPGWLFVWDKNGTLLAEQNLWRQSIYADKNPGSTIVDFQVRDLENDGTPEIVVMLRGVEYAPSRLAVLQYQNATLTEIKSYWHPGFLTYLYIEDVNNDGILEIICASVNNDFKRLPEFQVDDNVTALFMLDGRDISGQAPPYLGDAEQGSELWYYYLTPPNYDEYHKITGVRFVGEDDERIHIKLREGCFFYLNYAGEIVGQFAGDLCNWETEMHLLRKNAVQAKISSVDRRILELQE